MHGCAISKKTLSQKAIEVNKKPSRRELNHCAPAGPMSKRWLWVKPNTSAQIRHKRLIVYSNSQACSGYHTDTRKGGNSAGYLDCDWSSSANGNDSNNAWNVNFNNGNSNINNRNNKHVRLVRGGEWLQQGVTFFIIYPSSLSGKSPTPSSSEKPYTLSSCAQSQDPITQWWRAPHPILQQVTHAQIIQQGYLANGKRQRVYHQLWINQGVLLCQ